MSITGHKTRSVFDRYDITTEADRAEAAAKLAAFQRQAAHTLVHTPPAVLESRPATR
jgi:hypothetical protein